MNEPIVSFDTFSVNPDWQGLDAPEQRTNEGPPVLARIHRLPEKPHVRQRVAPVEQASDVGLTKTLRIDSAVKAEAPRSDVALQPPPTPKRVEPTETEEDYSGWLLRLEGILTAHSRWVVMLAVLAALGLTLILLRGGGEEFSESPKVNPITASEEFPTLFVEGETTTSPSTEAVEPPGGPVLEVEEATTSLIAEGPTSAPASVRPRAKLVGAIELPHADATEDVIETAKNQSETGYPRTATSDSSWLTPDSESAMR